MNQKWDGITSATARCYAAWQIRGLNDTCEGGEYIALTGKLS